MEAFPPGNVPQGEMAPTVARPFRSEGYGRGSRDPCRRWSGLRIVPNGKEGGYGSLPLCTEVPSPPIPAARYTHPSQRPNLFVRVQFHSAFDEERRV